MNRLDELEAMCHKCLYYSRCDFKICPCVNYKEC